jgi:hypothetical protein
MASQDRTVIYVQTTEKKQTYAKLQKILKAQGGSFSAWGIEAMKDYIARNANFFKPKSS